MDIVNSPCQNCWELEAGHESGKCLFSATTFKRITENQAYNVVAGGYVPACFSAIQRLIFREDDLSSAAWCITLKYATKPAFGAIVANELRCTKFDVRKRCRNWGPT